MPRALAQSDRSNDYEIKLTQSPLTVPAGAGKSTLARAAGGRRWASVYVDTGAIYRTVALSYRPCMGIGPKDTDGVTRLLDDVNRGHSL